MEIMSLHSILSSYGDIVELDYKFSNESINELKNIQTWLPATNNKHAINLTGPTDNLDLVSLHSVKHARNQPYNSNLKDCPTLELFFNKWTDLARCRAVKMNTGSFFKLHRDAYRLNDQFRIFIPLNKTSDTEWVFIYDGKIRRFKEGVPYILNTRKTHGSFAMTDDIYHVIMSVYINESNLKQIAKMLPNCEEN